MYAILLFFCLNICRTLFSIAESRETMLEFQNQVLKIIDNFEPQKGSTAHKRCVLDARNKLFNIEPNVRHGITAVASEDWMILNFVINMNQYTKAPRVYIDCAANGAIKASNTYFLDVCMGWTDICVEPNPIYHEGLQKIRSCTLAPVCVLDRPETVTFYMGGQGNSGLAEYKSKMGKSRWKDSAINITCSTLEAEIQKAKLPRVVDFLSLDVERSEFKALQGIDWDSTTIYVILMEVPNPQALKFLLKRRYKPAGRIGTNVLLLHPLYNASERFEEKKSWTCNKKGCIKSLILGCRQNSRSQLDLDIPLSFVD